MLVKFVVSAIKKGVQGLYRHRELPSVNASFECLADAKHSVMHLIIRVPSQLIIMSHPNVIIRGPEIVLKQVHIPERDLDYLILDLELDLLVR